MAVSTPLELPAYEPSPLDTSHYIERLTLHHRAIEGHIYALATSNSIETVSQLLQVAASLANLLIDFEEAELELEELEFPEDESSEDGQLRIVRNPVTAADRARTSLHNAIVMMFRIMEGVEYEDLEERVRWGLVEFLEWRDRGEFVAFWDF